MSSLPFPFPVVAWDDGEVVLIDQTVLPDRLAWRRCPDVPALCRAIVELAVRGAPAIGVAAAHGLALSWRLSHDGKTPDAEILTRFQADRQALAATRKLDQWLSKQSSRSLGSDWSAHYALVRHEIALMLEDPSKARTPEQITAPPGSPIGD